MSVNERKAYTRHGLKALMGRVKLKGLAAIDRRTAGARALLRWRSELAEDLGGEDVLSAQERVLVDVACRTKLLLDEVDCWLLSQRSIVNVRRKELLRVAKDRTQFADSLLRTLNSLGLKRRERRIEGLEAYLASKPRQRRKALQAEATP